MKKNKKTREREARGCERNAKEGDKTDCIVSNPILFIKVSLFRNFFFSE
jgi:hypothetical protein